MYSGEGGFVLELWTDGSALPNPGRGGYGWGRRVWAEGGECEEEERV